VLWDALTDARAVPIEVTWCDGDEAQVLSWGEVTQTARRAAAGMARSGAAPGSRVGILLTNSAQATAAMAGVWFAGATAVSLPLVARGMSADVYAAQLARLCERAGVDLLLAPEPVAKPLSPALPATAVKSFGDVLAEDPEPDPAPPGDDEVAFVQFSSGTTGDPRGAALTPRAIAAQLTHLAEVVSLDPGRDRVSAWLPLSHDMGLFGCLLLSWFTGIPLLLGTPERFLSSPRTWLDDCSGSGATLSVVPPSALPIAARAERAGGAPVSLRACLVGGERIPARALNDGRALLAGRGAAPTALTPAYGLAEATLAVAVAPVEEPARTRTLDAEALWDGRVVERAAGDDGAVQVVSCGPPLPDTSVRVAGTDAVGEILVRSSSLAEGYLDDPEATAATFADGELRTGDVGFLHDGELYPLARADDVLSVGGRRINVVEVEHELSRHPRLRSGSCVVVDVADDDRVRYVALAELAEEGWDARAVAQELRVRSLDAGGPPLDECLFLPRGSVPKTASGKAQRFRARQIAAAGDPGGERVVLRGANPAKRDKPAS
jgi:acyl-CoA synthetase (AMP-forming)/AMP-acid ligase II